MPSILQYSISYSFRDFIDYSIENSSMILEYAAMRRHLVWMGLLFPGSPLHQHGSIFFRHALMCTEAAAWKQHYVHPHCESVKDSYLDKHRMVQAVKGPILSPASWQGREVVGKLREWGAAVGSLIALEACASISPMKLGEKPRWKPLSLWSRMVLFTSKLGVNLFTSLNWLTKRGMAGHGLFQCKPSHKPASQWAEGRISPTDQSLAFSTKLWDLMFPALSPKSNMSLAWVTLAWHAASTMHTYA